MLIKTSSGNLKKGSFGRGRRGFEKDASLFGGGVVGLALTALFYHVLQNFGVRGLIALDNLMSGKGGKGLRMGSDAARRMVCGGDKGLPTHLFTGIIPEIGVLSDEFSHIGSSFRGALAKRGKGVADLTRKEVDAMRNVLEGRYGLVFDDDEVFDFATELMDAVVPKAGEAFRSVKANRKDIPDYDRVVSSLAREFERVHGNDKILGRFLKDVGRHVTYENLQKWIKEGKSGASGIPFLGRAAELAGYGAWAYRDIPMVVLNAIKRTLSSKKLTDSLKSGEDTLLNAPGHAAGKLLGGAQSWAAERFVKKPLKLAVNAGAAGEHRPPAMLSDSRTLNKAVADGGAGEVANKLFDTYVLNAATGSMKNMAYGFGKAIHDVVPEKYRPGLEKVVTTLEDRYAAADAAKALEVEADPLRRAWRDAEVAQAAKDADVKGVLKDAFKGFTVESPF